MIDSVFATYLLDVLKTQGYLDSYGNLTDKFDPHNKFLLNFFDPVKYPESDFDAPKIAKIR